MLNMREIYFRMVREINTFLKTRERVKYKFLVDMVRGILISNSVNLSAISRAIQPDSGTSTKHIHKRLDRNLGTLDISRSKASIKAKQCRMIDEETLIFFDPTEIVKKHGKKFEALSQVADGSDKREIKPGYPVTMCVGLKRDELIPLELTPYSYVSEDFESRNQSEFYQIDEIIHESKGQGTYVLDRGYDSFATVRHFQMLNVNFIIRMGQNRKYTPWGLLGATLDRDEIVDQHGKYKIKTLLDRKEGRLLVKRKAVIEAAEVELLGGRIDSPRKLTLLRVKTKISKHRTLRLYLLTNWSSLTKETLIRAVDSYLSRWKVEETIRFVKQQYHLEKIKVISLARIRHLVNILFMALVILTRISELSHSFSRTRAFLMMQAKRPYKLPHYLKFFLYIIADGLTQVLERLTPHVVQLFYKNNERQLTFKFMKDLSLSLP